MQPAGQNQGPWGHHLPLCHPQQPNTHRSHCLPQSCFFSLQPPVVRVWGGRWGWWLPNRVSGGAAGW